MSFAVPVLVSMGVALGAIALAAQQGRTQAFDFNVLSHAIHAYGDGDQGATDP